MAHDADPSAFAEDIAKLENLCQQAAQAIASARTIRETVAVAEVEVPHHLRANYPDIYAKAFREANLILDRKRKR